MGPIKTNRQLLSQGTDAYARKKDKKNAGVAEVVFNAEDREEYLTGFHKRKMKRKEMAAEAATKRAKQEKLEERKSIRESTKKQLEEDLKALREARSGGKTIFDLDSDEEKESDEQQTSKKAESVGNKEEADDFSDWEGIEEEQEAGSKVSGILKRKITYEADDSDDEEATVVVEQMDDGSEIPGSNNGNYVFPEISKQVLNASIQKAKLAAWHACTYGFMEPSEYRDESDPMGLNDDYGSDTNESPKKKKKGEVEIDIMKDIKGESRKKETKKRKKPRYLTKAERTVNVRKERSRNKEKRERSKKK